MSVDKHGCISSTSDTNRVTLTVHSSHGTAMQATLSPSPVYICLPSIESGSIADAKIRHPIDTKPKNSGWDASTILDFLFQTVQPTANTVTRTCKVKKTTPKGSKYWFLSFSSGRRLQSQANEPLQEQNPSSHKPPALTQLSPAVGQD